MADLKELQILIWALVFGVCVPFLEPRKRHNRTQPDAHVRPGLARPNIFHRTSSAPPRRTDYTPLTLPIGPPSAIPMLRPEFFQSDFWHKFHTQSKLGTTPFHGVRPTYMTPFCPVPLLGPRIFLSRLEGSLSGIGDSLGVPGRLVAMCLVA